MFIENALESRFVPSYRHGILHIITLHRSQAFSNVIYQHPSNIISLHPLQPPQPPPRPTHRYLRPPRLRPFCITLHQPRPKIHNHRASHAHPERRLQSQQKGILGASHQVHTTARPQQIAHRMTEPHLALFQFVQAPYLVHKVAVKATGKGGGFAYG